IIEPRSATMKMGFHQDSLGTSVASADEVLWYGNSAVNWDMSALETLTVANSKVLHNLQEVIDIAIKFSQQKTHIVIMSNGGFEGIHGKLTAAFDNS
ncbi:MAG TPA: UDP-N-acetylmuramate:L-alanyl-gamma-D-glutamyl-meso-diaminopimelate ligase, partial [Porticoccaceae bacterium]|nr:UDP-N-acetylmuramate:L-alanyl-gamma-D-glutamyl-meso-diaminopimelate ligase [Porticoccaceae bacterium]